MREGYNAPVKIVLDQDPERDLTILIEPTEMDGATHHDYSIPGTVSFQKGQTEAYPVFNALHDEIDEDDERVVLEFGTPLPDRVTVGNPGITEITITDDDGDGSTVKVEFTQGLYELEEGLSVELTVKLSKAADEDVTIQLEAQHFNDIGEHGLLRRPGERFHRKGRDHRQVHRHGPRRQPAGGRRGPGHPFPQPPLHH